MKSRIRNTVWQDETGTEHRRLSELSTELYPHSRCLPAEWSSGRRESLVCEASSGSHASQSHPDKSKNIIIFVCGVTSSDAEPSLFWWDPGAADFRITGAKFGFGSFYKTANPDQYRYSEYR